MNPTWIVLPAVAAFVLVVDLVTTHLRKQARRASTLPAAPAAEKGGDEADEQRTLDHD